MVEQICVQCRFFSPVPTWIGPPTWGYCVKQLDQPVRRDAQDAHPAFTWSDARCDGFEPGSQSVPCG